MRALIHDHYTPAAGLRVAELPEPVPGEGQVLIDVHAASPNPVDWHFTRGEPWLLRLQQGLRFPQPRLIGEDFAGTVAAVGSGVTDHRVGDRVFGTIPAGDTTRGTIAQRAVVTPESLAHLPQQVSMTDAATVGLAGLTAMQALRDEGGLVAGGRVLVWGAAGGVGHFAVQIAHLLGASRVDAVCSSRSAALVKGLGAQQVFAYTANETPDGQYDVIIDTVCTAGVGTLGRILAPGGTIVTVGANSGGRVLGMLAPIFGRSLVSRLHRMRDRTLLTRVNAADLELLGGWLATSELRVHVQESFDLDRAADAFAVLEAGKVQGKLAIEVTPDPRL